MRFLANPYLTLISRIALGGIFLLSGMTKLGIPSTFAENINSYEIPLPSALVQIMAVALPPIEVAVGIGLILGLFTRLWALVSGGLMVVFLVAMVQAAMRGLDPNCGCFAGAESNPVGVAMIRALGPIGTWLANERVGWESIARDVVFLLMAAHLYFVPTVFSLDNLRRNRVQEEIEDYDSEVSDQELDQLDPSTES